MSTSSGKHIISLTSSLLLILALFVIAWLFPSVGLTLGIIFLLFAFVLTCFMIVKRHREAYLQGRVSGKLCVRYICLEVAGILLAMILAGLLGRYLAEIGTRQIGHELMRIFAGVLIGLLAGAGVGAAMQKITGYFIKSPA